MIVTLNRDGKSRQFGFVGFRTEQEAEEAMKYFDKSFMDSSRIICEVCLFCFSYYDILLQWHTDLAEEENASLFHIPFF